MNSLLKASNLQLPLTFDFPIFSLSILHHIHHLKALSTQSSQNSFNNSALKFIQQTSQRIKKKNRRRERIRVKSEEEGSRAITWKQRFCCRYPRRHLRQDELQISFFSSFLWHHDVEVGERIQSPNLGALNLHVEG